MPVIAVAVAVAVFAAGVVWYLSAFRRLVRERVVVNLVDGSGFTGVVWAHHGRLVVLRDATTVDRDGRQTPVDGEAIIERHRILWVQRP